MLEGIKRLISGSPDTDPVEPAPPGHLDWITGDTPHRFRAWLADGSQRGMALEILARRLGKELKVEVTDEPDGRVRLDVVSTFKQGGAAYLRPLNVLRAEGVHVRGFERRDLVAELEPGELERLVASYGTQEYDETARRRLAALTGEPILRRAIEERRHAKRVTGWDAVMANAGHTTADVEGMLLQAALDEADDSVATLLVGIVAARGRMAELVSSPFEPDTAAVLTLARRRGRVAEAAFKVAGVMPSPLPSELTAVLCRATRRGGLSAIDAVIAMRKAEPSREVRAALEVALESSVTDVSDLAMGTLGVVFGTGARQYWEAWLASSSAPRRMAAEDAIGAFGDADDVPLAAEHLGKIIRRKSSISWEPPRGSEIITLLVRHRARPQAKAALDDLSKRWPKLPDELQRWLRTYHADLVPIEAKEPSAQPIGEPDPPAEPPLEWPLPSIEHKGKEIHLGFWDTDLTDVRDRFDELAEAHPAVTILDGDREWGTYRVDAGDPERLIAELWAQAHARPEG
jgi:hypothetical protein